MGIPLVAQWLGLHAFAAEGAVSVLGGGVRILQATQHSKRKKKEKEKRKEKSDIFLDWGNERTNTGQRNKIGEPSKLSNCFP